MKKIVRFKLIPLMILGLLFLSRCEKEKDSNLPTDGDGNVYDTVVIGTQTWLTENLKTTKYTNGTSIRLVTDNTEWSELELPAYCWYNNDPTYKDTYGALYNWYTAKLELLCPVGWHTPTEEEWTTLINNLGDEGSTNRSRFKALSVGWRWAGDGSFRESLIGSWWISSPEYTDKSAYIVRRDFSIAGMPKDTGYSVRCVKDN